LAWSWPAQGQGSWTVVFQSTSSFGKPRAGPKYKKEYKDQMKLSPFLRQALIGLILGEPWPWDSPGPTLLGVPMPLQGKVGENSVQIVNHLD
jgi:hypothetical protein